MTASPPEDPGLNLEVELSFAAGLLATGAGVAFFLFDHIRGVGFGTVRQVMGALYALTILEGFVAGMLLFLLYRGLAMATRLRARQAVGQLAGPDQLSRGFRRELAALDHAGGSVFHFSFRYLLRGGMLGLVLVGLGMQSSGRHAIALTGLAIFCAGVLLHLPGLFSESARRPILALRQLIRGAGLWWVEPPRSALPAGRWRYRLIAAAGSVALFALNVGGTLAPSLETPRATWSRAGDPYVELHFRQGGFRGHLDATATWTLDADFEPLPVFERLALNHYVALVPTADLTPGVHRVSAALQVQETDGGGAAWTIAAAPAEARFLVVP